jgi:DNA polymerase (family 10)
MAPTNSTIVAGLERIATLLEREGKEPTTIAAYRHASRAIAGAMRPAVELIEEGGVEAIHELGIGYLVGGRIVDWVRCGSLPLLDHLEERHNPAVELQRIPGIGPKLALEVRGLGIDSLEQLAEAACNGLLKRVCGFGPKRIAAIRSLCGSRERSQPVQLELLAAE